MSLGLVLHTSIIYKSCLQPVIALVMMNFLYIVFFFIESLFGIGKNNIMNTVVDLENYINILWHLFRGKSITMSTKK